MKHKRLIKLLLFLFFINDARCFVLRDRNKNPKTKYQIKNIIKRFKKKDLNKQIKEFIYKSRPSRMVGSPGHINAQKYIFDVLKKYDIGNKNMIFLDKFTPDIAYAKKFYQDDFNSKIVSHFKKKSSEFKSWSIFTNSALVMLEGLKEYKGHNIIWEKKGKLYPDEIITISANYDTISMDFNNYLITQDKNQPGADNNGTGVAILLSLANILSEVNINRTVRIIFFDFEELGFLGSHAFTKKYKDELLTKLKYFGNIHLLALGHDTKRFDLEKKMGNMRTYIRSKKTKGHKEDFLMAQELTQMGELFSSKNSFEIIPNSMQTSSHINFWNNDLRAMTMSGNWESDSNLKRHHGRNDFVETLNLKSYYENFQYIAGMILTWTQKGAK